MFILLNGTWKDKIKSVNLDWRREVGWSHKRRGEIRWSLKRRERPAGHSSKYVVCVFRPSHYYTKRFPATEERYARTLSDCIPITQSSPSKIKNVDFIFIYLRVFRCLSCSSIYAKNVYRANVSLHKTPATRSNNTVSPSGEPGSWKSLCKRLTDFIS